MEANDHYMGEAGEDYQSAVHGDAIDSKSVIDAMAGSPRSFQDPASASTLTVSFETLFVYSNLMLAYVLTAPSTLGTFLVARKRALSSSQRLLAGLLGGAAALVEFRAGLIVRVLTIAGIVRIRSPFTGCTHFDRPRLASDFAAGFGARTVRYESRTARRGAP